MNAIITGIFIALVMLGSYEVGTRKAVDTSKAYYDLLDMKIGETVRIKCGEQNTMLKCINSFKNKTYTYAGTTFEVEKK